jgi:hypothetical protein
MFYNGKDRLLKIDNLNLLHDSSLAIWFGDAGKCRSNNLILNTNIWGKKGTDLIIEYFESLDWKVSLFMERKNYRVKFDEESSKDFLKLIGQYLPKDRKCGRE